MQVVEVKPCRQGKGPRILAFSAFPFIAPPLLLEKVPAIPFMSLRSSAKADLNIRKHLDHLVLRNTAPGHVKDHPSD
jgi:hypothetical protein